jgi:hypothetical protein
MVYQFVNARNGESLKLQSKKPRIAAQGEGNYLDFD